MSFQAVAIKWTQIERDILFVVIIIKLIWTTAICKLPFKHPELSYIEHNDIQIKPASFFEFEEALLNYTIVCT